MSDQHPNVDEKGFTNSLIEFSELAKYVPDSKKPIKTVASEWSDAVVAWKIPAAFQLKSGVNPATTVVKKRRAVERAFTDLPYVNPYSTTQGDDYWSNSSNPSDLKVSIKCVGDEMDTFPIPPWKSNIEQGTYRYISDNGSYRTLKFMYDERKDWYTIRKKHPEKVSTTWHQNCKRMQRQMRRQLRKDLSRVDLTRVDTRLDKENSGVSNELNMSNKSSELSTLSRNSIEAPSGGERPRTNSGESKKCDVPVVSERLSPSKLEQHNLSHTRHRVEPELTVRNTAPEVTKARKETRVKSTHSDGAVNSLRKMKTIHERDSEPATTPVPQFSIPCGHQMMKSASDLFIENFSTRISALEDEIKKDSKWLRKNENELVKLQHSRAKYREQSRASFKESASNSSNGTPRQPFKSETLGCEVFSVKPMERKELRPLEKTKPFYKSSKSPQNFSHPEGTGVIQGRPSFNGHAFIGFNFNNTSNVDDGHSHSRGSDNSKQAMFHALTGTKMHTNNDKRGGRAGGFQSPSTITICDNAGTPTSLDSRNIEPYRHIPVVMDKKHHERKEALHNIPAILPEISGKRLEVTTISHRLL